MSYLLSRLLAVYCPVNGMYGLLKIWVRAGLQFYCSRIDFDRSHMDVSDKPLILACNHPNSFFDAMVMGAYHPRKMYFLARGDAFVNPFVDRLLRMMNMFPIYRMSEGKDKLDNNHKTFADCMEVLKQNGCVLIFSEGTCINEWKLRPLKKGTARLVWMCWAEQGIKDMIVQPVGINYHSFTQVPKRVNVQFSPVMGATEYEFSNEANFYKEFNQQLAARLAPLVLEEHHPSLGKTKTDYLLKLMLALPALAGFILHVPLYKLLRSIVLSKTRGTVFFDSVLFAALLLVYPLLVLLVAALLVTLTGNHLYWLVFLFLPFTAWCYKQFKAA